MAAVPGTLCRSSRRGLASSWCGARTMLLPSSSVVHGGRCWLSAGSARRVCVRKRLSEKRQREATWGRRGYESDVRVEGPGREPPSFAFAFDIDGVLLHVAKPIPGAPEVLRFLNEYNIPFILLTNGGGKHETERVQDLSEKLGVQLSTDNFVQSHTPFQELLEGPDSLRDKTVLVTGSDYEKCRAIFKEYGFKTVITPADIYAADPTIFPFQPVSSFGAPAQPLPKPLFNPRTATTPDPSAHLRVDAVFVLNDPRDWALDIQVITDLLLSQGGFPGTYSRRNGDPALPGHGWQQDGQPAVYFSNADLFWSAAYPLPRLGQGAFQAALAGLWRRVTGDRRELAATSIGKPHGETYRFAERVMAAHRAEVLGRIRHHEPEDPAHPPPAAAAAAAAAASAAPLRRVYMVGDNPESDIAGANGHASEAGTEWVSVLVKTGVWSESRSGRLEGVFKPRAVVDDVVGAVKWALRREGWVQGEDGGELK